MKSLRRRQVRQRALSALGVGAPSCIVPGSSTVKLQLNCVFVSRRPASGDEETAKRGHPKVHRNLRGTDLAHTIIDEGYCAAGNLAGCSNVHRYIRAREGARLRHPCFTPRDKSRIQAEFLPNRQRRRQAAFDDQIFCGT